MNVVNIPMTNSAYCISMKAFRFVNFDDYNDYSEWGRVGQEDATWVIRAPSCPGIIGSRRGSASAPKDADDSHPIVAISTGRVGAAGN